MLGTEFRPWGQASWLLPKIAVNDWHVIGCASTEDRSAAIGEIVAPGRGLARAHFLEILDPPSGFDALSAARRAQTKAALQQTCGALITFHRFELSGSPVLVKKFVESFLANCSGNVILDVTSLPKRYFFPIIKLLSQSNRVANLLVTYSVPEAYHPGDLAFEPQAWSFLPMFQREDAPPAEKCERIVIGVGFLPFGLPDLLKHDYQGVRVSLVLPFPPGPPQYQRNWQFVNHIEKMAPLTSNDQIIRVSAYDASRCFDHFETLTDNGRQRTVFAPYGPKPHSLAMCLFAIKHECEVYYTQPKMYHPEYSSGIARAGGLPIIHAYSVKLDGRWLY